MTCIRVFLESLYFKSRVDGCVHCKVLQWCRRGDVAGWGLGESREGAGGGAGCGEPHVTRPDGLHVT